MKLFSISYKLPPGLGQAWAQRHSIYQPYLLTDTDSGDAIGVSFPPGFFKDNIFSLTKSCNYMLNHLAEKTRCLPETVIVKTDIDCVISPDTAAHMQSVPANTAYIYRYWQVRADGSIKPDPRCCGTVAMACDSWRKVGGYNSDMQGYGYDDADIIYRCHHVGIKTEITTTPKVLHIEHEKHNRETVNPIMRSENNAIGKKWRKEKMK
jgi:hypothetical protein